MAITDGANRNPNAATAGQPTGTLEAGTQAALRNRGGVAGAGDAPAGPSKTGPQDAGTAAAMKAQK